VRSRGAGAKSALNFLSAVSIRCATTSNTFAFGFAAHCMPIAFQVAVDPDKHDACILGTFREKILALIV